MATDNSTNFDEEAKKHIDNIMNGGMIKSASRSGVVVGFIGAIAGFSLANHVNKNKIVFSLVGGILGFYIGTTIKK